MEGAPGNGAAILFLAFPFSAVMSIGVFLGLTVALYRRYSN